MNQVIASIERVIEQQKVVFSFSEYAESYQQLAEPCSFQYRMSPSGDGELTYVSPNFHQIYGISSDWLLQHPNHLWQAVSSDSCQAMERSVQHSYETLEAWIDRNCFLTEAGKQEFQGYAIPEKLTDGTVVWNGFAFPLAQSNRLAPLGNLMADYNQKIRQAVTHRTMQIETELEKCRRQLIVAENVVAVTRERNLALKRLATSDGLTHLANRRRFDQCLNFEWRRMMRSGQPLSVILCDVDYFKRYNDTYGHPMGDSCLKQIAQALRSVVQRAGDFVARYGGEEFVFLLPNTDGAAAMMFAKKVRAAIHCLNLPHRASTVSESVTLSLGVGSLIPQPSLSPEMLLMIADKALYRAKHAGRDCAVQSE
jgi:diguanylate cyclase (GGDEF)-like protein